MNKVDITVKNAMLGSPGLFPNRMAVLSFIFLNAGGGYFWNKKGEADCVYGMPKPTDKMDMKDLNERMVQAREYGADRSPPLLDNMNFQLAQMKLEKLQRKHVADHIELYATEKTGMFSKTKISDVSMLAVIYSLNGTLLGTLEEPKKLDKEWAQAASEVAEACVQALKTAKAENTLPKGLEGLEARFTKALDTLEPITNSRANQAKVALALKGIWDELKMDEALGL